LPEIKVGHLLSDAASTSLLHEFGDVLEIGVMSVDTDLRVTGWNRWLEQASGTPATTVIGQSVRSLCPEPRPSAVASFERALTGSTVIMAHRLHECFLELPCPSGFARYSRMQQSARILPLRNDAGVLTGAVALIQDVTERVAREDELQLAMERAQQANQAKSNFLAAMSHELRTPIGAVTGYADLLATGVFGPVTTTQQEHLERIQKVSDHLLKIVEEILTFARIEAGREEVHLDDVDAAAVVRRAIEAVEPLAMKKGITVGCRAPDFLRMRTDEVKLRQIFINLLGNAVKFTSRGEVHFQVDDGHPLLVQFVIRDTGPGISPADLEHIFEPFVQAEGPRSREGTGLGLSVSRQLARLLGGDISVESQLGVGSVFTVSLPRFPS
jgi:PAS domain S-box-containing protein